MSQYLNKNNKVKINATEVAFYQIVYYLRFFKFKFIPSQQEDIWSIITPSMECTKFTTVAK